jgi:hypothetical protein
MHPSTWLVKPVKDHEVPVRPLLPTMAQKTCNLPPEPDAAPQFVQPVGAAEVPDVAWSIKKASSRSFVAVPVGCASDTLVVAAVATAPAPLYVIAMPYPLVQVCVGAHVHMHTCAL